MRLNSDATPVIASEAKQSGTYFLGLLRHYAPRNDSSGQETTAKQYDS